MSRNHQRRSNDLLCRVLISFSGPFIGGLFGFFVLAPWIRSL